MSIDVRPVQSLRFSSRTELGMSIDVSPVHSTTLTAVVELGILIDVNPLNVLMTNTLRS